PRRIWRTTFRRWRGREPVAAGHREKNQSGKSWDLGCHNDFLERAPIRVNHLSIRKALPTLPSPAPGHAGGRPRTSLNRRDFCYLEHRQDADSRRSPPKTSSCQALGLASTSWHQPTGASTAWPIVFWLISSVAPLGRPN